MVSQSDRLNILSYFIVRTEKSNFFNGRKSGQLLSPPLKAFPSSYVNNLDNGCSALQSVTSLEISPDGKLWVADSGNAGIYQRASRDCPAKLVIYNLREDHRTNDPDVVILPRAIVANRSILTHMTVDFSAGGAIFVYISESSTGALIVIDMNAKKAWKLEAEKQMKARNVRASLGGEDFSLRSGISGLALLKDMIVFGTFSAEVYGLPISVARRKSDSDLSSEIVSLGSKGGISDGFAADDLGNVYFGLQERNEVAIWYASLKPLQFNVEVLSRSGTEFEWINSLFVDDGYLYVVSNRYHRFVVHDLNPNEANFKVCRLKLNLDPARRSYMAAFVSSSVKQALNKFLFPGGPLLTAIFYAKYI